MVLALTSSVVTQGRLYDIAASVLAQRISQVEGIGQVTVGGSALPAVRVAMKPPRSIISVSAPPTCGRPSPARPTCPRARCPMASGAGSSKPIRNSSAPKTTAT